MKYQIIRAGESRSFPQQHPFIDQASERADVAVILGAHAGDALLKIADRNARTAILIELGMENLGVHAGERRAEEGSNILGFARFRLGTAAPTNLVELVRQPRTDEAALSAAREIFEAASLQVAVCGDFTGRILDRLVRPYYNAALRRLDEGLASAEDLDTTLRMGLGYPEGPIQLLERTGLAHHCEISEALFEAYGDPVYAPARRARVARLRQKRG
jgi:3-hydroxybutyryl-CoA dehydrogenase